MKGLFKLLFLLFIGFVVMALFKGGDYIRQFSVTTGIELYSVADVADIIRLDTFMAQRQSEQRAKDKAIGGN